MKIVCRALKRSASQTEMFTAMIDQKLLSILVCPVSKAPLQYHEQGQELICVASALAYPIRDGIPVMLESQARSLTPDEKEVFRSKH